MRNLGLPNYNLIGMENEGSACARSVLFLPSSNKRTLKIFAKGFGKEFNLSMKLYQVKILWTTYGS